MSYYQKPNAPNTRRITVNWESHVEAKTPVHLRYPGRLARKGSDTREILYVPSRTAALRLFARLTTAPIHIAALNPYSRSIDALTNQPVTHCN